VHSATLGEVYVLGVDPSAQGLGLGGVLLDCGLSHLLARGCDQVLLYVEADNTVALRLYERSGFTEYDRDTQWSSP
jgi:mycothiol synthase